MSVPGDEIDLDLVDEDEVIEQLNFIEQLKQHVGVEDNLIAALLANQVQLARIEQRENELLERVVDLAETASAAGLESGGGSISATAPAKLLVWPQTFSPEIPLADAGVQNLVGTLPTGTSTFDFSTGEVEMPSGRTEEISQSLNDLVSPFARSLMLSFDNRVHWWIPEQESGAYQNQNRQDFLRDVEVKKLKVRAFAPTSGRIYASTNPRLGVERAGAETSMVRVTWSEPDGSVANTLTDEYETLDWTTEEDVETDGTKSSPDLDLMNVASWSVIFTNSGANDAEVAARVKNTVHDQFKADSAVGFADLKHWESATPKTIPAGETNEFRFEFYPYHFARFDARCAAADSETNLAGSVLALTE